MSFDIVQEMVQYAPEGFTYTTITAKNAKTIQRLCRTKVNEILAETKCIPASHWPQYKEFSFYWNLDAAIDAALDTRHTHDRAGMTVQDFVNRVK